MITHKGLHNSNLQRLGPVWEARILKVRTTATDEAQGLAEFVVGKTRSKGWEPMWIALSALRPLL